LYDFSSASTTIASIRPSLAAARDGGMLRGLTADVSALGRTLLFAVEERGNRIGGA
jgi:hypothetical protein